MTLTKIFIENASNPSSKNHWVYLKALEAGAFISEITQPGEVILFAKKSGDELFSCFFGAILTGRIPLIIQRPSPKVHQTLFEKKMVDLKNQVNATLCICERQDTDKFERYFKCRNSVDSTSKECPIIEANDDDLAFIQLSSGTTGVSKICEVTHGQIVDHCLEYGKVIGMDKTKSIVSWLPLYHDMGLIAAFLLPIIHDAEFHIMDPFDWLINPRSIFDLISNFKGTHCWMPSFAFNYLSNKVHAYALNKVRLDSLERIISCSEPTFCSDLKRFGSSFESIGLNPNSLQVCYALAENIFAVSQTNDLKETEWKGVKYASCGTILPNVSVKIINNGLDVTNQDDGEVWIKSPFMPRTNKCVDGWYNTGDIGFLVGGNLHIIGRAKDLFVSYGVNVYPEMVEHVIANVEGIIPGRVVCFGEFDKTLGTNRVVALAETENITNNILKTELSTLIKEEFNLTAIVNLVSPGTLIKTSSGKFCRIKNKEQYAKNNASSRK